MFRALEESFLNLAIWFFSSHGGTFLLLGLFAVFIFLQFVRTSSNILPAILGAACLLLSPFHHLQVQRGDFADRLAFLLQYLQMPKGLSPVPFIEPILTLFIAPPSVRFQWEEIAGFGFMVYLGFVIYHALQSYRKTKRLIDVKEFSFSAILSKKSHRPNRSKGNELGSGDLAKNDQIAVWTKPSVQNWPTGQDCDTTLLVTDLRGSEGIGFKNSMLVLPREERNRHVLAVAKTGSGKTTRLVLPILYNDCMCPHRSTIVIDSKPEMWKKLAAMTRKYNPKKNIMLFNPLEPHRSMSWNILSKIESDTDCKLIANTIIMATDVPGAKSDSPFFRNNALAIMNAIMVGLLSDQNHKDENGKPAPKDILSMPRIHELVQGGMKPLCAWLESHPDALRTSRTFVELSRSGSQNADTIMSEMSMRLAAWDLRDIRATTSFNELDLAKIIEEPTLFIVEFKESQLEMLRPMANVIVVELLRYLTKYAETCPGISLPRPVGLVIDEFASALGKLPDIEVKLNTIRSRNVSIVAAIQSTSQVKALYGDHADTVLAGFGTKIFMPALDLVDSEWASKESGQMTIRFKTASIGSNKRIIDAFASKNDSTQEQVQQRAVLTPDEIGRPVDNINTFFLPNTPVFQGFLVPHFKIPEMLSRIREFDSEDLQLKIRDGDIPYVDRPVAPSTSTSTPAAPGGLPAGITNTAGWTPEQIDTKLKEVKAKLDWDNTTGSAKKWWEAFETENKHRTALVLRLSEELANRKATITEFFLAYVYSNTENIQANLHYLDYTRLKKDEEKRKREASGQPEPTTEQKPPTEVAPTESKPPASSDETPPKSAPQTEAAA